MLLLIFVLNIIILVTSNPLQVLQSCPLIHYHQNPANTDLVTPINFNAYRHQIQNQPLYLSNAYEDQLNRLNLIRYHDQNIIYQPPRHNPSGVSPNTINNYIIVPQEYMKNESIVNEIARYIPQVNNAERNNLWIPDYDFRSNVKYKTSNHDKRTNSSNKLRSQKHEDQENKQSRYNEGHKSNKSRISKTTNTENLRQNYQNIPKPKSRISNLQREYTDQHSNEPINKTTRRKEVKDKENTKKKTKIRERSKSTNKLSADAENKEIVKEGMKLKDGPQLQISATDCFDINEDCTNLENRRTRNNYNNDAVQAFQHQFPGMPKEFTNNIASYLNNYMPNQNLNSNLFGGNGNLPYNFDYLYQTPQSSTVQSNGSDKRRRTRRRKKKQNSKSKTEPETSSRKPNQKNGCTIILDVTPKPTDDPSTTEIISTEKPTTIEIEPEKQVAILETPDDIDDKIVEQPDIEIVNQPLTDKSQEYTSNDSQEYVIPYVYDNGIGDEYYPDFTLDNIYTSKEDNHWNFHGRHFYESDNKPEMSRERRKFETNVDIIEQNEIPADNSRKLETSVEEIQFKTPPKLEFPDFKTEMINKDKYNLKAEPYYQPYSDNEVYQNEKSSAYSDAKTSGKSGKNIDNTVETVYAHSKVIKYGAAEHDEKVNNIPFDYIRNNVYTSDEETTVVVAKSLNYPKNYY